MADEDKQGAPAPRGGLNEAAVGWIDQEQLGGEGGSSGGGGAEGSGRAGAGPVDDSRA